MMRQEVAQILEHIERGRGDEARIGVEMLCSGSPLDPFMHLLVALLFGWIGDSFRANYHIVISLALGPEQFAPYTYASLVLLNRGHNYLAKKILINGWRYRKTEYASVRRIHEKHRYLSLADGADPLEVLALSAVRGNVDQLITWQQIIDAFMTGDDVAVCAFLSKAIRDTDGSLAEYRYVSIMLACASINNHLLYDTACAYLFVKHGLAVTEPPGALEGNGSETELDFGSFMEAIRTNDFELIRRNLPRDLGSTSAGEHVAASTIYAWLGESAEAVFQLMVALLVAPNRKAPLRWIAQIALDHGDEAIHDYIMTTLSPAPGRTCTS